MMNSKMIISACKTAFLFVLLIATTTATATATAATASTITTMESASLRGVGNSANDATPSSIASKSSEIAHTLFSSVTDTVRKLTVGCTSTGDSNNNCDDNEYFPLKCKKRDDDGKKIRAVFRSKCHAKQAGFKVKKHCKRMEECTYFEKGRDTSPVTCNDGTTWPDKCVAKKVGKCNLD